MKKYYVFIQKTPFSELSDCFYRRFYSLPAEKNDKMITLTDFKNSSENPNFGKIRIYEPYKNPQP